MKLFHALRSFSKDIVDGSYTLRCGERVWPLGVGMYDNSKGRYETARNEVAVTCPGCKLKVAPGVRTILRLLYDHGAANIGTGKAVEFTTDRGLVIWAPKRTRDALYATGLVGVHGEKVVLRVAGKELAATYPKVREDF